MSDLDELQRWMTSALRRRVALTTDSELSDFAMKHFTGNDRLSPVAQLEIYRQQYWLRHTSALVEDFPGVGGIIGQRAWERLVEEYLDAHPPRTFSLRDLGANLADFIACSAGWLHPHDLVLDMARLEWAYVEAFDAAEVGPLTPEKLSAFDENAWDTARLVLSPSLRLLRVQYPVVLFRKRLCAKTGEAISFPEPDPQRLVIHRSSLSIHANSLDEAPFALLEALGRGATIPEACERACLADADGAESLSADLGEWFQAWVRRGWITDVSG